MRISQGIAVYTRAGCGMSACVVVIPQLSPEFCLLFVAEVRCGAIAVDATRTWKHGAGGVQMVNQALTGVFPKTKMEQIAQGPLNS